MNAQTTIVEEKFENDKIPLSYYYLPKSNKVIIEKGEYKSISTNRMIKSIFSFDSQGKKEILAENVELMRTLYSPTENGFSARDYSKLSYGKTYKYFINKTPTPALKFSELFDNNKIQFYKCYFNDKYELGFTNQKSKTDYNFFKDQFYLEVKDIFTGNLKRFAIEKPDINRLIGDAFLDQTQEYGFKANIVDNDTFVMETNSTSKNYKTNILYRTFYSMEGKKIKETSYNITVKDFVFFLSVDNGGYSAIGFDTKTGLSDNAFTGNFFRNKIYEDNKSGDVYVYGLLGNKIGYDGSTVGYYIFKFDNTGKKIWESINTIDDKNDFNNKKITSKLFSNLTFYNDNLYFSTGTEFSKQLVNYALLDKKTGDILSKNKITFNVNSIKTIMNDFRYFLVSTYERDGYDNKVFDYDGLIAIDVNSKVVNYLKNIDSKNKIFFNAKICNEGIWLLESDNKEYYKVTFFKN